jgi:hypothetical protein
MGWAERSRSILRPRKRRISPGLEPSCVFIETWAKPSDTTPHCGKPALGARVAENRSGGQQARF